MVVTAAILPASAPAVNPVQNVSDFSMFCCYAQSTSEYPVRYLLGIHGYGADLISMAQTQNYAVSRSRLVDKASNTSLSSPAGRDLVAKTLVGGPIDPTERDICQ